MGTPVLLIHGGATWRREYSDRRAVARSLDHIARGGYSLLEEGASALEAVHACVRELELDPLYNAGLGSKLQADGICRLSASVMDGARGRFGAVINVEELIHPSDLALALLDRRDRVLDGRGAHSLAVELGMEMRSPLTEARLAEWRRAHAEREPGGRSGTVGAVALDSAGRLAAMTSTGGRGHERPGRVSDSATPAGNYADAHGAISCTGVGEHILESAPASRICAMLACGLDLETAADRITEELRLRQRELGFIAVDRDGHTAARFTTECLTYRIAQGGTLEGWPTGE